LPQIALEIGSRIPLYKKDIITLRKTTFKIKMRIGEQVVEKFPIEIINASMVQNLAKRLS
jgi:hypothetical protein